MTNDLPDDDFRNDELVRMAAVVMDPTHGRPTPPARRSAGELIELAHRQRRASIARNVSLLVVPALLLAGVAVGLAAGRAPEPAGTPSPVAAAPPTPLAVADAATPRPARRELQALAKRTSALDEMPVAGTYTFVYTREWERDPTARVTPPYREHRLWWAADRSGRRMITLLSGRDPGTAGTPRVVEYAPGALAVPVLDPAPVAPVLASQLTARHPLGDGAHVLRAVVELYRFHALDPPRRAAALQVLADAAGLKYLGGVVDRAGRAGVAVSADSESGDERDIAIFEPATGRLLSYERLDRSAGDARVVASVAFLSAGRTNHLG